MKPQLLEIPCQLETERLILRCYREGDGQVFFEMMRRNRAHVWDAVPDEFLNLTGVEDAEVLIRELMADWGLRRNFFVSMWEKATSAYLGHIPLFAPHWDVPRIEIGYIIDQAYQGRGFVTEGGRACVRFAFEHLKVNKIALHCYADNARSCRVAERLGFAREGLQRDHAVKRDGTLVGWMSYGLTRADYLASRSETDS